MLTSLPLDTCKASSGRLVSKGTNKNMSARRMFSDKIVESDAFLDMPISTQALYFHLGMEADDDGFVNPKKVMRIIGASDDDLKVLASKRFVLPFENGVVVIKHWLINNMVRKDFYKETVYLEQKQQLRIKENKSYTENVNKMLTEPTHRIGKDRIGKVINTQSISFDSFWNIYPKKVERKTAELKWVKLPYEVQLAITADIPRRILGRQWKAGYIPNPTTYLNGERWNDVIEVETIQNNHIIIE